MTHTAVIPPSIRRKWDAIAMAQLCEALARESAEVERLSRADADADYWYEQAMEMQRVACDEHGMKPGLIVDGSLVLVPGPGESR